MSRYLRRRCMKKNMFISLLLCLIIILSSCSLPNKLPSSGVWYNEDLDISLEFITEQDSNYTEIINVVWNSRKNCLYVHIGYGEEIYFYVIDEHENEIDLLQGHFEYKNDEFIIIASELAEPFEISGVLSDANNRAFIFTNHLNTITSP